MGNSWYQKLFGLEPQDRHDDVRARADHGDADAQFSLGVLYSAAEGEQQDLPQAARWYQQAAEQNHPLAEFNLSLMLAEGQGVPRDDAGALRWMRRAADHGDAGAQYSLGKLCHRASLAGAELDAAESRIEAYKWLTLAAAQGYKDAAISCAGLSLVMSREELAEANARAQDLLPPVVAEPEVLHADD